jgi:exo-1,4-beta-D-glucosaminidase
MGEMGDSFMNQCVTAPGIRLVLADNWRMQSSAHVSQAGKVISSPDFQPDGWYTVSIPATVIAGLLQNGVYEDPFFSKNLQSINSGDFGIPWWYRKEFVLPPGEAGKRIWLNFQGLNYRANIWLNGIQIAQASEVVGPFRQYEFDITHLARADGQVNVLALEIFRPQPDDLAITFVVK